MITGGHCSTPRPVWLISSLRDDEPRNPLAVLRVPPTQTEVVEHTCARSADDLVAIAQLLERALKETERLMAERVEFPGTLRSG
jgi:diadenosine tetraphosphate (Ap4A) HIT family hydrolase